MAEVGRLAERQTAAPVSLRGSENARAYWTPNEVAKLLRLHRTTVTRMFQDEPGVLKIGRNRRRSGRPHVTLRIPDAILQREIRRLGQ